MKKTITLFLALTSYKIMSMERFSELYNMTEDSISMPTPIQPQGPFYPVNIPIEKDADLTVKNGKEAKGDIIFIGGRVMDTSGFSIQNAQVEIWQACFSGRYNHPKDPSLEELDENFQYYGTINTNENGEYLFKTILPGAYKADEDWYRPPHIHFCITAHDYKRLITQSYFDPNSFPLEIGNIIRNYNENDHILKKLNQEQQNMLIVTLNEQRQGVFNIYLEKR